MAASRPCAALALLYLRFHETSSTPGAVYLQELPTPRMIDFIVAPGAPADVLELPLQTNLYSETRFYVEVRWTIEKLDAASTIVTVHSQLVDPAGVPITPVHPIEQPSRILVTRDAMHPLSAANDL
jgi:hypothetical protein